MTFQNNLNSLNANYQKITDLIPTKYNFGDFATHLVVDSPDFFPFTANFGVFAIHIQTDGKTIISGNSNLSNNSRLYTVVKRFNVNGTPDTTFTQEKFYEGAVFALDQQSNNKIIVGGVFNINDNTKGLVRLNTDGTYDDTFIADIDDSSAITSLKVLPDNSIIIIGNLYYTVDDTQNNVGILKLNSDGSRNNAFNDNIPFLEDGSPISLLVDNDQNVYLGSIHIVKLLSDGTQDLTFNTGSGVVGDILTMNIDSNGKIICGGNFNIYNGQNCNQSIIRLNTNGSLDTSFQNEGLGLQYTTAYNPITAIAVQSDDKIIAAGYFNGYNNQRVRRIIRFNTDGTQDTSFNTGTGFEQTVLALALDSEENVLCGGAFLNFNGHTCTTEYNYLNSKIPGFCVKLDPNGNLIGTSQKHDVFATGIGFANYIYNIGCLFNTNLTATYASQTISESTSIPFTHSTLIPTEIDPLNMTYDITTDSDNYDFTPHDGTIKPSDNYFGLGSQYFTQMYPGLLVLAANNININEFSITGDYGSSESFNKGNFDTLVNGVPYAVFYKNKLTTGSPSILEMIVVPGTTKGITQTLFNPTYRQDHVLSGLHNRKELYVFIFSRNDQQSSSEELIKNVVTEFFSPLILQSYSFDLSPALRNLATEGSLDTSIINGNSQQRTLNDITIKSGEYYKVVGNVKDGNSFNNTIETLEDLPFIKKV